MKYREETQELFSHYYSPLSEKAIGIGFSIFDRQNYRILTSQTRIQRSKKASTINTE